MHTGEHLSEREPLSVDHLIPRRVTSSRSVHNLLVTKKHTNSSKNGMLPAPDLLARWADNLAQNLATYYRVARDPRCTLARYSVGVEAVCADAEKAYLEAEGSELLWSPEEGETLCAEEDLSLIHI